MHVKTDHTRSRQTNKEPPQATESESIGASEKGGKQTRCGRSKLAANHSEAGPQDLKTMSDRSPLKTERQSPPAQQGLRVLPNFHKLRNAREYREGERW